MGFKKIGRYKIIACIFESELVGVEIATKENISEKYRFLLNKFRNMEENKWIFTSLFMYYLSKKNKDLVDFFTQQDWFYVIFRYKEGKNAEYLYEKSICMTNFADRLKIFENLMIRLYDIICLGVPPLILQNITRLENVLVDEDNISFFNYDLRDISRNESFGDKEIFKKIHGIISSFFAIEADSKYNKSMEIILKSCKYGIYHSIPEMIVNFKHHADEAQVSSLFTYWKRFFNIHKHFLPKLVTGIMTPALIFAFVYLIYTKINASSKKVSDPKSITIGGMTYTAGTEDKSQKTISMSERSATPHISENASNSIYLPPQAEIDFDDYIVKFGDTFDSICTETYGGEDFSISVASFNGMERKETLIPGMLIRLPNKADAALWLENNSGE